MENKSIWFIVLLLIINIIYILVILETRSTSFDITKIEYSGSGIDWNCETHLFSMSYDPPLGTLCESCGQYHPNVYEFYGCDNGLFSWCYPGYIVTYNDCHGFLYTEEYTSMSGCH